MNEKDRLVGLVRMASEAFDHHQIVSKKVDRWCLAEVKNGHVQGTYFTEVVSLSGGRLFVGGDIDDCVFAYADTVDPREKVKWIASSSLDYACKKASIGLTDNGKLTKEGRSKLPSPRVVYAWCAVRRLDLLLNSEFPKRTRIEPGFVGTSGKAWHPWIGSCEVDVEVSVDNRLVYLVDQKNAMRIPQDVETIGPLLYVPSEDQAYALDVALANGHAKIKGE